MSSPEPPLYVDLDGTVLSTDLLHESFLSAFKASPWVAVQCVGWLMQGRARMKEELAARATIDVATLPYRQPVIDFLKAERARGRRIVLATASWTTLARSVADHLGLFDEVIATSREENLKGEAKALRIAKAHGERCFDYIGDSRADIAVWRRCRHAYVVEDSNRLSGLVPPGATVKGTFPRGQEGMARAAVKALRPHQWAKNLLLFVPLIASHRLYDVSALGAAFLAFAAFCLVASSAYLSNDLLDLGADRAHPRKRQRPLASGRLSIPAGIALWALSLGTGIAIASLLPLGFQVALAAYLVITIAYSYGLKRVAILDVISLATLYTVRIVAGMFAIGAAMSFWLLAFAMFVFYSLALVKRYAELVSLETEGIANAPGRGYHGHDAEVVLALGSASAMVSALVLALYINGEAATLYRHPPMLWLLCPILLYWVSRIWLLAARGQMDDDPVLFAVRDAPSYFAAAVGAAVIYFAT